MKSENAFLCVWHEIVYTRIVSRIPSMCQMRASGSRKEDGVSETLLESEA